MISLMLNTTRPAQGMGTDLVEGGDTRAGALAHV
jgi:hypothetical protein